MEIFEWIIWIILAVFTLTCFITWKIKKRGYKKGSFYDSRESVALIAVPSFVIIGSIILIIFLFINVNKFHLIWIYPVIYILILLRMSNRFGKVDKKQNEMSFEDIIATLKLHLRLADLYFSEEKPEVSIEICQRGLQIAEENINSVPEAKEKILQYKNSLAYYYAETQNPEYEDLARKLIKEASKEREDDPAVLDTMGYVKIVFGKTKEEILEGVKLCERAKDKNASFEFYAKHIIKANERLESIDN